MMRKKVAEGGETLDLYVNHIITEDKDETRTSYTVSYQAYDLSSVLHQFTNLKKDYSACSSKYFV